MKISSFALVLHAMTAQHQAIARALHYVSEVAVPSREVQVYWTPPNRWVVFVKFVLCRTTFYCVDNSSRTLTTSRKLIWALTCFFTRNWYLRLAPSWTSMSMSVRTVFDSTAWKWRRMLWAYCIYSVTDTNTYSWSSKLHSRIRSSLRIINTPL